MSTAIAIQQQPTRQQIAAQGRSAPGKVTGKLKRAIEAMVWRGLKRPEAAADAGLTEHALYCALRRPHVKAFYLAELEVLRTSERSRNIHRLVEIRDAADNMPAVNAIKMLEQINDTNAGDARQPQMPGLVIIVGADMGHMQTIEAKPLTRNAPGHETDGDHR